MKQNIGKSLKLLVILSTSVALTACGSLGGFSELLGISNEGIDAQNVEVNDTLKNAGNGELPTPQGGAIAEASVSAPQIVAPQIVAPQIVAPKITAPKITTPKVTVAKVTTPKITTPIVTPVVKTPIVTTAKVETPKVETETPKVEVKPIVVAATPTKVSPLAYKFVDLFTFRSDMRAGKMLNPLATARRVATISPDKCKLEGNKFTCGEYFITVQ